MWRRLNEAYQNSKSLETLYREDLESYCQRLIENDANLTHLQFINSQINAKSLSNLTDALGINCGLKYLAIIEPDHIISATECSTLMTALLENSTLEEFMLQNELEKDAIDALAEGIKRNRTLKKFMLVHNNITLKEVRTLIAAVRENHFIMEFQILNGSLLLSLKPSYLMSVNSEEAKELNALINRNKDEVLQTFPDLMARGKTFQASGLWQEASETFEQIIKNESLCSNRTTARAICDEAHAYQKFCLEMLQNPENANTASGINLPMPTNASVGRDLRLFSANRTSPTVIKASEQPSSQGNNIGFSTNTTAKLSIGIFGNGEDFSTGDNRSNTHVSCHCACTVQ